MQRAIFHSWWTILNTNRTIPAVSLNVLQAYWEWYYIDKTWRSSVSFTSSPSTSIYRTTWYRELTLTREQLKLIRSADVWRLLLIRTAVSNFICLFVLPQLVLSYFRIIFLTPGAFVEKCQKVANYFTVKYASIIIWQFSLFRTSI